MLKSVSRNTVIVDGRNENFELSADLFDTTLKMQPEMTEAIKICHFHAHLPKQALQTFRNISTSNKKTIYDVLNVFRQKYVKQKPQATTEHKWHKLTFDPKTKSLSGILEELNECTERAFDDNAQQIFDNLLHAKIPALSIRSLSLAYLENSPYDQNVAHLEEELELIGLENSEEPSKPAMTAVHPNGNQQTFEQTTTVCHYRKKPGHVNRHCRKRIKRRGARKRFFDPKHKPFEV